MNAPYFVDYAPVGYGVKDKDTGKFVLRGDFPFCRDMAYLLNGARAMQDEDSRLAREQQAEVKKVEESDR